MSDKLHPSITFENTPPVERIWQNLLNILCEEKGVPLSLTVTCSPKRTE